MNDTLHGALQDAITDIKAVIDEAELSHPKLTEADTEHKVIDPLLHTLGYKPLEIYKQGHDSVTNQKPDYAVLPGTPHKWFLEAKSLHHALKDGDAEQAVNYAANQGAEWAVLTNGRVWYIYDAWLKKPLAEKRVFQIDDLFTDPLALETLSLLSRSSMLDGGLSRAWTLQQAQTLVRSELQTPQSQTRKLLRKLVTTAVGSPVDDALIGRCLAVDAELPPAPAPVNGAKKPSPVSATPDNLTEPPFYSFSQLTGYPSVATGKKPALLRFADGTTKQVATWVEAARETVSATCGVYGLPPLPFNGGIQGKRSFINSTPTHVNGADMDAAPLQFGPQTVYMHTSRSTRNFAKCLVALFAAVGAPNDAVRVSIK